MSPNDKIFAACGTRLLAFSIAAHSKEAELPSYWQAPPKGSTTESLDKGKKDLATTTEDETEKISRVEVQHDSEEEVRTMQTPGGTVKLVHEGRPLTTDTNETIDSNKASRARKLFLNKAKTRRKFAN